MSFLIGPASGALVAGGVYYGFSNLIHTRTEQHRRDLHTLSARLIEDPTFAQAAPSAATRITHRPFTSLMKAKWNQEIEYLFAGFASWDQRAQEWGRRVLYGRNDQDNRPESQKST
ncbi:hypothetical protein FPV67DRAFT_167006 [Lyophyllum atratum]|nr:hypothetical protein FPV67DRAFT_167006 [Lyophyllum atratum]